MTEFRNSMEKKNPLVSVIIPTHNRAELLKTAVQSVLDQTFKDYELIIINDNCTDQTDKVVKSFGGKKIKLVVNIGLNGPSISRNLGIANAKGRYIAFLDDDDEWMPKKLEKQINLLEKCSKNVCGVYSSHLVIDRATGKIVSDCPIAPKLRGNLLKQFMSKNPITTTTLVLKKKCLEQVGTFDVRMRYMEDRDLWIRLSKYWDFEYIAEPLIKKYRHGNDQLSDNLNGQTQGRSIFIKRYKKLLKKNKRNLSNLLILQGVQYFQLGEFKEGRRNLIDGLVEYPLNYWGLIYLSMSLFGKKNYLKFRKLKTKTLVERIRR